MAFGDTTHDEALRAAWHEFCDRLSAAGDLAFKDTSPANALQRADAFRYLTQNLGQAYDLALETKDSRFPVIHPFCGPGRKLGGDNADFVYLQAWIDGASMYRITGNRGTARFINFTVQGPRPERDVYYGADHPNLHEPFGDTPEANITGDDLVTEPDGSFVLHVGGERREPNWLPTTPGSRKLFMRQGFDSWEERSAQFSIERIDIDSPRPVPTPQDLIASMRWAGDFLTGAMTDWPDRELQIGSLFEPDFEGIAAAGADAVSLHHRASVAGVGFEMEGARGVGVHHLVVLDHLVGGQADDLPCPVGLARGDALGGGDDADGLSLGSGDRSSPRGRPEGLHRVGIAVRFDGAGAVNGDRVDLDKALRTPAGLDHEGGTAQVADGFDGLTRSQPVGQGNDRPLTRSEHQQIGLGVGQYRTAHFLGPVIVMGDAAQTGLDAADDDIGVRVGLAGTLGVHDDGAIRTFVGGRIGRVGVV